LNRHRLREALRHLLSGQITNFDFDERTCFQSRDRAVREIASAVWGLYDDLREHRLVGGDKPTATQKDAATRCILFLQTELAWEWPVPSAAQIAASLLLDVATLGALRARRRRRYESAGDFSVWPFFRRADYEAALRNPRLLTGESA
jgi:hypothetical protein